MSLMLIAAVAATVAASVGYLAGRRSHDADSEDEQEEQGPAERKAKREEAQQAALAGLPLALGDVVQAGSEERWLAGAIVAREQGSVVAAVFLAPEGAATGAVVAFPAPRLEIYWLHAARVDSPEEPPATLEISGITMRRRGRVPAALECMGQGTPALGEAGIVAMYEGGGQDVAAVIACNQHIHAWAGKRLDPEAYERLGQGENGA